MLIEFQVENFRSFKERQTFSMVAGAFPEHQESNTFEPPIKNFGRLVRSAAIYGPNAAGKTNLLRAMKFMKDFVVASASSPGIYQHTPFKLAPDHSGRASAFQVTFVQDGSRYEYGFEMGPNRIEKEWLVEYVHSGRRVRGRSIFDRVWNEKSQLYVDKFPFLKGQRSVWSEATRPDALFLSTAVQLNSTQLRPVFDWFHKRLVVIVGEVSMNQNLTIKLLDEPDGKKLILPFLREADLGIGDLAVKKEPIPPRAVVVGTSPQMVVRSDGRAPDLITVTFSHYSEDEKISMGLDFVDESSGTQILFKSAGAWLNVLKNGEVLLFDEIDTNLHPAMLRFLIGQFHSKAVNPNNAQLICSTHNTYILNQVIFRRDQVWFVEKGRNGASKVYPLTEFRPRNDEVLDNWYMRGRYGAQPILSEAK